MVGVRTVAALVSTLDGIWVFVLGTFWSEITGVLCAGKSGGCGSELPLQVLGIILVIDSLVCFLGVARAFYFSAILAAIGVVIAVVFSIDLGGVGFIATAVLALVTIVLDVAGALRKKYVSDETHPLNLPVFG